ncbi:MAG: hypothetical protein EAZ16_00810 [Sphingobacteriales bacterium]|jgi:hypothetical protein|nr:MAG: hypothetical protein EAZ16_00810 [Sphingobacteriales bacterium]
MNTAAQIAYKNTLKQFCQSIIEQRIATARQAMAAAQEAANAEEKSSAGDKYETARAMGHLEKDMHAKQLAGLIKELSALNAVPTGIIYQHIQNGAYIKTSNGHFFIAAGLGKQVIENKIIYLLSPTAPLAQQLQGKTKGHRLLFNKEWLVVEEVF